MLNGIVQIIDRLMAVIGAIFFAQFPMYMQEYRQQLAGHVAELQFQVELMRKAALQSGKTLEQFIHKFQSNGDSDFSRQGDIMNAMVERLHFLSDAYTSMTEASFLGRPFAFLNNIDVGIVKSTFYTYRMGFSFSLEGIIYALFGAVVGYLVFKLLRNSINALRAKLP